MQHAFCADYACAVAKAKKKSKKKPARKKKAGSLSVADARKKARDLWGESAYAHLDHTVNDEGEQKVCAVGHGDQRWTAPTFEDALAAASGTD